MSHYPERVLRRALAGSLLAALVVVTGAGGPALAQDAELIEEIHVTGTRIPRVGIDTLQPATVITGDSMQRRGLTNVADALNDSVLFGPPGNSPVDSGFDQATFNAGANFVDFLGLGAQRTLTLVDGHRFVNSNPPSIFGADGGLQVDFNVIPIALVDRIETIATGGAPIYGSDAVAGTINVILKDDFEGFDLSMQSGMTESNRVEQYQIQGTWGANTFDGRGNVVLSVEHDRTHGLLQDDRRDLFQAFGYRAIPGARDVTGDGELDAVRRIVVDDRVNLINPTGVISPGPVSFPNFDDGLFPGQPPLNFNAAGEIVPYDPGEPIPGQGGIWAEGGEGWDLNELEQAASPLERVIGTAIGRYDITENVRFRGQFNYADVESEITRSQGGAFQTALFGETSGALLFSSDHPLLTPQARQTLDDLGAESFWINRVLWDVTNRGHEDRKLQTWRVVAGLEGDFEVMDRSWQWDISANFGETALLTRDSQINDLRFFNAIDAVRLTEDDIAGLSAAELQDIEMRTGTELGEDGIAAGDVICQAVLDRATGEIDPIGEPPLATRGTDPFIDGCVPLNIFGRANQDAIDWVGARSQAASDISQRVFRVNLIGDLGQLPAGPLGFAIGYENRKEKGSFEPDNFNETALGRFATILPTSGSFETDEFYGEAFIPLIGPDMAAGEGLFGFPVVDSFSLEGAARSVDHDLAGRDTTFTGGGRLAFVPDLVLRGNFTRSIRSPSIQELFSPITTSFATADDPCDAELLGAGEQPENRQANCQADGLPSDFDSNVRVATARGRTGGNPDLENETADSWSVGVILEPRVVPGLLISADYFNIEMEDRIASLTLTQIMESCYDVDPGAFPPPTCDQFQRDEGGQVVDFLTGQTNAATSEMEGLFISANYSWELADLMGVFNDAWGEMSLGRWTHQFDFQHNITNKVSVIGERPPELVGGFTRPSWAGNWDFIWNRGPAQFFWRMNWQSSAKLDPTGEEFFEDADGNLITRSGMRVIHNASFQYNVTDQARVLLRINNINNRQPNRVQAAANHFGSSEIFGRTYSLRFQYSL